MKYRVSAMAMAAAAVVGATVMAAVPAWATAARPGMAARPGVPAMISHGPAGLEAAQARQAVPLAGPGPAAPGPAAQEDPFHICLKSAPSLCLQSNGAGKQVTINSSSAHYSNFHVVRSDAVSSAVTAYQFDNASGNCLRAGNNGVVKIENGTCSNGDPTDWWLFGSNYMNNAAFAASFDGYMYTNGKASGDNVWWGTIKSGRWVRWTM